jgi:hypothetical protein
LLHPSEKQTLTHYGLRQPPERFCFGVSSGVSRFFLTSGEQYNSFLTLRIECGKLFESVGVVRRAD